MRCRGLERTFIESVAAGYLVDGEIVAICAEPGMGKTQLAMRVAKRLPCDEVMVISLTGIDADLCVARLTRAWRRVSSLVRKQKSVCAVIDDVCSADECDVDRICRIIMRIKKLGAAIILTLLPEAEQLLDGLGGCLTIGKSDLMIHAAEIVPVNAAERIMRESCGVPGLVDVLQTRGFDAELPDTFLPAYGEALHGLVDASLRDSLIEEERIARFGAYLLGSGTWEDLERTLDDVPSDGLALLLGDAALITLDHGAKTFSCVGVTDDIGLAYCSDTLSDAAACWSGCACAAVDVLVGRGDVARAARIMELLEGEARQTSELRHGFSLLEHGETALVREALAGPGFVEDASPYASEMLSRAFDAFWSADIPQNDGIPAHDFAIRSDAVDAERTRLIVYARRILADADHAEPLPEIEYGDRMAAGLSVHAKAVCLLEKCRIRDCLNTIAMYRPEGIEGTLAGSLLALDEEVARVLLCEKSAPDLLRTKPSEDFFERMGFHPLIGWGGLLLSVREAMMGICSASGIESAAMLAERRGNRVVASALCIFAALSDLARRAPVSAHVRAKHAGVLAEAAHSLALEEAAAIVQAVCAGCSGDDSAHKPLMRRTWLCDRLGDVADAVARALSNGGAAPLDLPAPGDCLWLIQALAHVPGPFAQRFRVAIPPAWQQRLDEVEKTQQESRKPEAGPPAAQERASDRPARAKGRRGVEIRVLGGFTLLANGIEVSESKLNLRSVRTVLAMLAAAPGHRISRVRIIESIWPDCDFLRGRDRLYQAVSRIRYLVREIDQTLDPITFVRNDGMLCLRMDEVRCDVDAFIELARGIMGKEGSDEDVVDQAQTIEQIYRGELFVPFQDSSGAVRTRARELRTLYVDAMVLASESALRLGKRRQATHFAEAATIADASREDAACALIRALKASGRTDDALRHYRARAKKAKRGKHTAPSAELRAAIGQLIDDDEGAEQVGGGKRAIGA